jgi:putative FmdB family regulatory protein
MPTYEYECSKCGNHFDYFQSMKDAPLTDCPDEACGGKGTVRRLISSGTGLIFKGSGFYVTDYKKSNCSPASSHGKAKSDAPACECPNAKSCPMAENKD